MKFIFLSLLLLLAGVSGIAQENDSYNIEKEIRHLPVISQGSTGTCWSFATTSFLESEIIRKGMPETDLSEIYFVNFAYINKAKKYMLYYGKYNFSEGGQAHDVFDVIRENGAVPFDAFPGIKTDDRYRHGDLVNALNMEVTELNKKKEGFNASEIKSLDPILKEHLGKIPKKVKSDNDSMSPLEFFNKLDINPNDYIEITSYSHHPFYSKFVLEVPDNWSQGLYYNLPIDELMEVMDYSIRNGYSFCWDGDTSEKTFEHRKGKADLPEKQKGKVTQELRQKTFFDRSTTDDHLMHVVGISKNSAGQKCFYTKNSWGEKSNNLGGYLHMTEDYVRLKTIAILVHKDAIPDSLKSKLNL